MEKSVNAMRFDRKAVSVLERLRRLDRYQKGVLLVLAAMVLVFSVLPWSSTGPRVLLKLLLLPLVMGVSYEILKLCGRYDNFVTRIVSAPGLWLQRITTKEPDDSMIECAIAAVTPVLPENREDGRW